MEISWSEFKKVVDARGLSIQYVEIGNNYWLKGLDGAFSLECFIPIDPTHVDTAVFLASYKSSGNVSPVAAPAAFAAKTIGTKKLFKRVVGLQNALVVDDNTIIWVCTFNWVKFMAVEIMGGETGDYVSLCVLDTATGTFSTIPNYTLNQFGFNANVSKDFYEQRSEFDADVYIGLQIKIVYHSKSAKNIGINFVMNEVK